MKYLKVNVSKGLMPLLTSGCIPPIGLLYTVSSLKPKGNKLEVIDAYNEIPPLIYK